jgi:hypothetical protein
MGRVDSKPTRGTDVKIKYAVAALVVVGTVASAQSSHSVRGYTRRDGTYVAPHMQTNPNSTKTDNWSSKPNVNPYTDKAGTIDPYKPSSSNPSGSPYNSGSSGDDGY